MELSSINYSLHAGGQGRCTNPCQGIELLVGSQPFGSFNS